MMSMSKMFCLFLCLGCAVAQSSSDEEDADTPPGPDRFGNAHGSDAWLAAAAAEQDPHYAPSDAWLAALAAKQAQNS